MRVLVSPSPLRHSHSCTRLRCTHTLSAVRGPQDASHCTAAVRPHRFPQAFVCACACVWCVRSTAPPSFALCIPAPRSSRTLNPRVCTSPRCSQQPGLAPSCLAWPWADCTQSYKSKHSPAHHNHAPHVLFLLFPLPQRTQQCYTLLCLCNAS